MFWPSRTHLPCTVRLIAEVGFVVTVSVTVFFCEPAITVPTGITDVRLDWVIVSEMVSLFCTVQVTVQPPPCLHVTVPVTVLWWALAAPATPTTAKPRARTSVTTRDTARWPVPLRRRSAPSRGASDRRSRGAAEVIRVLPGVGGRLCCPPRSPIERDVGGASTAQRLKKMSRDSA